MCHDHLQSRFLRTRGLVGRSGMTWRFRGGYTNLRTRSIIIITLIPNYSSKNIFERLCEDAVR